ncbi:MAG: chloride channel protein, partial [Terriglobia bacterium]
MAKQFGVALKPRTLVITFYAAVVGCLAGFVAEAVLKLIYLFTHVFFQGRWSFQVAYPDQFHLGLWIILIPPIGGLVAGLTIHFIEPTLKGHGTPEAMEAVILEHSAVRLRVGILKPITSALAIGTGGPFGAEGPIIQTGGAFGSVIGGWLGLSPYERRILLASGAAAGLAATFYAPFAGILLAIELLLFEFSGRSFIPVGVATAAATVVSVGLRNWGPLFPSHMWQLRHLGELWLFALLGVLIGLLSVAMIRALSWFEDFFDRFPLKPAAIWAPVAGGVILGVIGYFFPHVLGTGYDTISGMLNNKFSADKLLEICGAKFWALVIALGSGTTGGVFAPSLIIGGGFGAAFGAFWHHLLPYYVGSSQSYALAAMGALFAGTSRVPLTSVAFMLELNHNPHALLPLIVACFLADLVVRILNRDSIMTAKLHKRGLLVPEDYSAPVLIGATIGEVVRRQKPVPANLTLDAAAHLFSPAPSEVLPVVEPDGSLAGVIEAYDLLHEEDRQQLLVSDVARQDYVVAQPGEAVDSVAKHMLSHRVTNAVVMEREAPAKPFGIVRSADLLRLQRH